MKTPTLESLSKAELIALVSQLHPSPIRPSELVYAQYVLASEAENKALALWRIYSKEEDEAVVKKDSERYELRARSARAYENYERLGAKASRVFGHWKRLSDAERFYSPDVTE